MTLSSAEEGQSTEKQHPNPGDPKAAAAAIILQHLTKTNTLIDNAHGRLGGGREGAFFEEGSRLDEKTVHGQLPVIFTLIEHLQESSAAVKRFERLFAGEMEKEAKGPLKANSNTIAMVRNVVEQETAGKFRDLEIKNERKAADVEKANAAFINKLNALEGKVKKSEASCKAAETQNSSLRNMIEAQSRKIESLEAELQAVKQAEPDMGPLENKIEVAEEDIKNCYRCARKACSQLGESANKNARYAKEQHDDACHRLDALEEGKAEHAGFLRGIFLNVKDLKAWKDTHDCKHDLDKSQIEEWCSDNFVVKEKPPMSPPRRGQGMRAGRTSYRTETPGLEDSRHERDNFVETSTQRMRPLAPPPSPPRVRRRARGREVLGEEDLNNTRRPRKALTTGGDAYAGTCWSGDGKRTNET